jgi:cytochrome c-type biogenesis protein
VETVSLGVAFSAGLLSFLSPCVLPMVPVYIGALVGPEAVTADGRSRFNVFFHTLSFVLGFVIVFTLLGAGFGLFGLAIGSHAVLLRQISGAFLVFFGLFLIASRWLPALNYEKRITHGTLKITGYARSVLIGAIFTLAWTPCVGPILASILTIAVNSETAARGALLLAVYGVGLGLPFLVIGAAFGTVNPLLKRITRYGGIIHIVSGIILVAIGLLALFNKLTWLQ